MAEGNIEVTVTWAPADSVRMLLERAASMLTGYGELIRRDGASHVEEHHYLPEVEHVAAELRALMDATPRTCGQEAEHQAGVQRVNDVLARMEKAKAEHDAAMADAARFRWLDEVALSVDMVADPDNLVQVWHETLSGHATTGRTLREAVDEAMKRHNVIYPAQSDNRRPV